MKSFTKVLLGLVSSATLLFQVPSVQQAIAGAVSRFITAHPAYADLIAGILASLMLVHNPQKPNGS